MKSSEKAMGEAFKKRPLMINDYEAQLIHTFMEWLVTAGQPQFLDRYMNFTDSHRNRARSILQGLEERLQNG